MEDGSGRPRNPMINIGAITTHSLVGDPALSAGERFERVAGGLSAFAGRRLDVDDAVFESELDTAHRNLSPAHMVRSHGMIDVDGVATARYSLQGPVHYAAAELVLRALAELEPSPIPVLLDANP